MIGAGRALAAIAAVAAGLAGGCTGAGQGGAPLVATPADAAVAVVSRNAAGTADQVRADRVADALLMADRAERAKDDTALAQAAGRLERLGATPQTAQDDEALQRWFASLPADAAPMRGRALGPAYRSGKLGPGAVTRLNQTFLGGRSAQIVVRVARGPAPRLIVHDQSDRQICTAAADPITCRWVPLYTQRHRIEIVNTGPESSEFYIVFD